MKNNSETAQEKAREKKPDKGRHKTRLQSKTDRTQQTKNQNPVGKQDRLGARPLWLFLCEPGLAPLLAKELKFHNLIGQKTRIKPVFLRNYDMIVIPDSQVIAHKKADFQKSRLALHVLNCPIFGKSRISDNQVRTIAKFCQKERSDGFVSSVVGKVFQRQEIMRYVSSGLKKNGLSMENSGASKRPLWLFIVDELYYFGFSVFNHHDGKGRTREGDRSGSLPATVAAAMLFAAKVTEKDVIWDPVAGSGVILSEAATALPDAEIIGSDIDKEAISLAKARVPKSSRISFFIGDGQTSNPGRQDITCVVANVPWGKQFKSENGNFELYVNIINNALQFCKPEARFCLLTSDYETIKKIRSVEESLLLEDHTQVKIRGVQCSIWII